MPISADEAIKLQTFLRGKLENKNIALQPRKDDRAEDSAEVMLNGESIGVLYRDTEDGETSYHFQWTIIEEDLEDL